MPAPRQAGGRTRYAAAAVGPAAISLVYFALLRSGDDVLVPDNVYGPNREHGEWLARDFGVTVRYYDPMIGAGIGALIRPNTRLIWMESPGSVTMEVPDSEAIVAAARERGVLTAIDNTGRRACTSALSTRGSISRCRR